MKKTYFELKREQIKVLEYGLTSLFWWISMNFMLKVPINNITLVALIEMLSLHVWYFLCFVWSVLNLRDVNGVGYFINIFTKYYFKGSKFDKFNEKYNSR